MADVLPLSSDIGDYLRRRRIRDILGIMPGDNSPEDIAATDPSQVLSSQPLNFPQVAPTKGPKLQFPQVSPLAPSDPNAVPASVTAYRDLAQQAPKVENYPPGALRKVGGFISGLGAGLASSNPQKAADVEKEFNYAPFNNANSIFQQKLDRAKGLMDVDLGIQGGQLTKQEQLAKIQQAEAARLAEIARRGNEEQGQKNKAHELDLMAPDYETKIADDLRKLAIEHPPKGATEPTNEFELWHQQHPNADASEWIALKAKTDSKVPQEFATFFEGYKRSHPNAKDEDVVKAYSDATTKPPQLLLSTPIEGGGSKLTVGKAGTVTPPGTMTPQQMGSEQVSKDKEIESERVAQKKTKDNLATAQRLVTQAETAKDPSQAAAADAALVMQVAGAMKPEALGKLRWNQSEQDFLIKKTRSAGGDFDALASKVLGGEHIILTSSQRKAFLETMQNLAGGPESLGINSSADVKDPLGILGGK